MAEFGVAAVAESGVATCADGGKSIAAGRTDELADVERVPGAGGGSAGLGEGSDKSSSVSSGCTAGRKTRGIVRGRSWFR